MPTQGGYGFDRAAAKRAEERRARQAAKKRAAWERMKREFAGKRAVA